METNFILTELAKHMGAIDMRFEIAPDGRWSFQADGIGGVLLLEARGYGGPALAREPLAPEVRAAVIQRDGNVCCYCGRSAGPFHIDHVVPQSRGGSDNLDNLVVACAPCNMSKGAKSLEEWREWQRKGCPVEG